MKKFFSDLFNKLRYKKRYYYVAYSAQDNFHNIHNGGTYFTGRKVTNKKIKDFISDTLKKSNTEADQICFTNFTVLTKRQYKELTSEL